MINIPGNDTRKLGEISAQKYSRYLWCIKTVSHLKVEAKCVGLNKPEAHLKFRKDLPVGLIAHQSSLLVPCSTSMQA